jgi:hypothetical protein
VNQKNRVIVGLMLFLVFFINLAVSPVSGSNQVAVNRVYSTVYPSLTVIEQIYKKSDTVIEAVYIKRPVAENVYRHKFPVSLIVLNTGVKTGTVIRTRPDAKSKKVGVVFGSLTGVKVIKYENLYAQIEAIDYNSMKKVIGYVPSRLLKTIYPRSDFGVAIDLSEQKIYIYNNGKLIKTGFVSTGIESKGWGTPIGQHVIGPKGKVMKIANIWVQYWNRFNKSYMIHSIPCNSKLKPIPGYVRKLGYQASHGCIRLPMELSKWFYTNIPANTPVIIEK